MSSIDILIEKGTRYHDEGKFEKAINVFRQILNIEPKNVDALIKIGLSYRNIEDYDTAIEYYNQALNVEPDNKIALNNIGYALQCQNQMDGAIEMYKKSLEIDPCYELPLVNITNIYFDEKQYDKAIEVFQKALDVEPFGVANWIDLGRAYRYLEDYDKSIEAYNNALKIDHYSKIAWNNIGWVWYCKEDFEEAIASYTKSLEIDWLYDLPFSNLIKIYKKMIKTQSGNINLWNKLANAFLIARAYNRAIESCNRALTLNSGNVESIELHKKIVEIKTKFDMNSLLTSKIEEALNLFASISTSVLISDVIDYIKFNTPDLVHNDNEIKFKIFETIQKQGINAKLVVNKLIFYREPVDTPKIDYMK